MGLHLLIDADSSIYKAGLSNETRLYQAFDDEGCVVHECQYKADMDKFMETEEAVAGGYESAKVRFAGPLAHSLQNIKRVCQAMIALEHTSYKLYISGKGNFRKDIYPEYKANRTTADRPVHEKEIREYLKKYWNASEVDGEEVDDRVSWEQCTSNYPTCIVAIDKDLLNTPGLNYNYDTQVLKDISPEEGTLNFARQLLTGDSTDNIPGLKGIGPKTANKLLPSLLPNWQDLVLEKYKEQFGDEAEEKMVLYGRLLWMRRKPDEMWDLNYEY
jgi:DNA polymerase-1